MECSARSAGVLPAQSGGAVTETAGIILAGGLSQRFAAAGNVPKALAPLCGLPLILHVAAALVEGGAGRITVLTGAHHESLCAGLGLRPAALARAMFNFGDRKIPFTLRSTPSDWGTAGRLTALTPEEWGEGAALLAYTDILTDAPLAALREARANARADLAVLAVNPTLPWGELQLEDERVLRFIEKPATQDRWINGGVFALDRGILAHVDDPMIMLERAPALAVVSAGAMVALRHQGFWHSVETQKDLLLAEQRVAAEKTSRLWRRAQLMRGQAKVLLAE